MPVTAGAWEVLPVGYKKAHSKSKVDSVAVKVDRLLSLNGAQR